MTERSFRRAIAALGYRLHKHGAAYDLIDLRQNALIASGLSLAEAAEWIARLEGWPELAKCET